MVVYLSCKRLTDFVFSMIAKNKAAPKPEQRKEKGYTQDTIAAFVFRLAFVLRCYVFLFGMYKLARQIIIVNFFLPKYYPARPSSLRRANTKHLQSQVASQRQKFSNQFTYIQLTFAFTF